MFYCYPPFRCDAHNDQKVVVESLEESGDLKGQDMAKAFKTPEARKQCSKQLDRFGLPIFMFILNNVLIR